MPLFALFELQKSANKSANIRTIRSHPLLKCEQLFALQFCARMEPYAEVKNTLFRCALIFILYTLDEALSRIQGGQKLEKAWVVYNSIYNKTGTTPKSLENLCETCKCYLYKGKREPYEPNYTWNEV